MTMKRVFALLVVGLMPTLLMVWLRTHQASGFASTELVAYPLIFGTIGIAIVYALKKHLLRGSIAELNG